MKRYEIAELLLALAATAGVWLVAEPMTIGLGRLVLLLSALLLFQSLIRDLWLLSRHRRGGRPGERREARCMCIESMVGAIGVLAGGLLALILVETEVRLPAAGLPLLVGATLVSGFILKDWVLTWRPLGLKRDPDHVNIVVRW